MRMETGTTFPAVDTSKNISLVIPVKTRKVIFTMTKILSRARKGIHQSATALKSRYQEDVAFKTSARLVAGASVLSLFAALNMPKGMPATKNEASHLSLDDSIPEGSVLIPVKVQNEMSLDGVFEESGYVDLYSVPEDERKKSVQIASGVKMIRSPGQHDQFSVIVKSDRAAAIVHARGNFFVTLQSRNHHKSEMPSRSNARVVTVDQN